MAILTTKNLVLSPPHLEDLALIKEFEIRNEEHLNKWESKVFEDSMENRLKTWIAECAEKRSVRFLMKSKENPSRIIGFCNFTQIYLGAFCACYLGYKIDHAYEGKGLMQEALTSAIDYIFEAKGLHRIMANFMPSNKRSATLLDRLGFKIEGFAKNYLLINGKWEDHVLTALSKEEWLQKNIPNELTIDNALFRAVRISDAKKLAPLITQLGYSIEEPLIGENILTYASLQNQKAWVAEKSGQIVGCIAFAITSYFHRRAAFLRVIALVVDKNNRRTGIGKNLLKIAESFALKNGCSHIELTSGAHRAELGTHDFYRSMGYSELNDTKKYFAKRL